MTILVDPLRKWPSGVWCHMGTDDHTEAGLDELHAMAARIGLQRRWFQGRDPRHPHYDLRPSKRALAVTAGAVEVDAYEFVRRVTRAAGRLEEKP